MLSGSCANSMKQHASKTPRRGSNSSNNMQPNKARWPMSKPMHGWRKSLSCQRHRANWFTYYIKVKKVTSATVATQFYQIEGFMIILYQDNDPGRSAIFTEERIRTPKEICSWTEKASWSLLFQPAFYTFFTRKTQPLLTKLRGSILMDLDTASLEKSKQFHCSMYEYIDWIKWDHKKTNVVNNCSQCSIHMHIFTTFETWK